MKSWLSDRERQALMFLACGYRTREMAEAFGTSMPNVAIRLRRIRAKLGSAKSAECISLYRQLLRDELELLDRCCNNEGEEEILEWIARHSQASQEATQG